ncbi:hypothetical protein [uncultured Rikenella sp.]|nr:hypothetical protein [uncultured Rikenella sp.]
MRNVGSSGYSRSSTVNGIDGVYLHFYEASLDPSHMANRARGFQLRCLSE